MSQFDPKNPAAWARPPGSGQQINAGLFQNPLISAQPFAQMGMINAAAFSQQAANMGMNLGMLQTPPQPIRMQTQQPQQKNRTFSGVVTKIHDSYGFVDDDVFFQVSTVRGALPRAGDRVMVEATYNPSMPFQWNAFRVQLIGDKGPASGSAQIHSPSDRGRPSLPVRALPSEQSWSSKPLDKAPPMLHANQPRSRDIRASDRLSTAHSAPQPRPSAMSGRHRSPARPSAGPPGPMVEGRRPSPPRRVSPPRMVSQRSPKRSPIHENPPKVPVVRTSPRHGTPARKHESTKREHSSSVSARNHSPSSKREVAGHESQSPPRRRARIIPRYQCFIPKPPLVGVDTPMTVIQMRKRYPSLYIPSDFIQAKIEWPKITSFDSALSFSTSPVSFNILHKNVDCPGSEAADFPVLSPDDADYRFCAKVILLSHPGLSTVHQKAFGLLADGSLDEDLDPMPVKRCFSFLVGTRGKEMMAIGGPWSPSLDGADPEKDPQVLVRTAIRTVRALTGIDLSKCSRWYKMAELRYYRAEKERMDTCALMLPDTCGLMPESDEIYQQQVAVLRDQLNAKIEALEQVKLEHQQQREQQQPSESNQQTVVAASEPPTETSQQSGEGKPQTEQLDQTEQTTDTSKEQASEEMQEDDEEEELSPTHWSKLDVKTMKVAELRQELMARDLETKGVKTLLCTRLQEAIDKEKASEGGKVETETQSETKAEIKTESKPEEEAKKEDKELTEEEKKALEKFEKEKKEKRATLERHYLVPRKCGVLVYPNRTAKCGKFDCKVVTLHTLLDYRIEDIKEHSFELAVMAECISEMLDRAQAFTTYKVINCALDKDSEKKRRDEAKLNEVLGQETKLGLPSDETKSEGTSEVVVKPAEEDKKEEEKNEEEKRKILAEPRKIIIVDRTAFQAFAHFDQNLCGYLMERDLEEVWHSMGINLSRSQVQKLLKKVLSRDRINYRNFTDSWVNKDGTVTYKPGVRDDQPNIEALTKGNILPITEGAVKTEVAQRTTSSGSVTFNGSIMNIPELLERLSRMESLRNVALQKVDVLEAQLKEGAKNAQTLEKKKKRLEDDVEKYRKRLHDAEKCLKNTVDDTVQMRTAIQEFRKIGERMIIMSEKLMPAPKEPEKSSDKDVKSTKKEKKDDKDDKQVPKKKDESETKVNGETEEKKELQLVDEVGCFEESMETDIVLSEEVADDDEKETKKEVSVQQ